MKLRYRVFRRSSGIFFLEDCETGKQESLRTRDKAAAHRLLSARNEAYQQPALNMQIGRAYLLAGDPLISQRTWQHAMEEIVKTKHGATLVRWISAIKDKALDPIRGVTLIKTQSEQLLEVLRRGTVSTNVHLRKLHNFCVDMGWLPWPIMSKKHWPKVVFKEKRAITAAEHQRIVEREHNPELRAFYQLIWFLGGSQTDIASLCSEDVDWTQRTIAYSRKKTGTLVMIHFGEQVAQLLSDLPSSGPLFPRLAQMVEQHRGKEFHRRCKLLGIHGVSLHSYRYAWAFCSLGSLPPKPLQNPTKSGDSTLYNAPRRILIAGKGAGCGHCKSVSKKSLLRMGHYLSLQGMKANGFLSGCVVGCAICGFLVYLFFTATTFTGYVEEVVGIVGGTSAFVAAIAYFCRAYIQHVLGIQAEQSKIIFANVYERKAEAIEQIYKHIVELTDLMKSYVFPSSALNEEAVELNHKLVAPKLADKWQQFYDYYAPRKIYFDKATKQKIDDILITFQGVQLRYGMMHPSEKRNKSS